MNIPTYTKPAFWGFVGGVLVCVVVGFMWGGWVTGSTARKDASAAAHTATVVALAPRCAEQFRAQPDAAAKIEALAKASSWERSSLVEKSGFAVLPSTKSSDSDIARACSESCWRRRFRRNRRTKSVSSRANAPSDPQIADRLRALTGSAESLISKSRTVKEILTGIPGATATPSSTPSIRAG